MPAKKKNNNLNQPATKGDLADLRESLREELQVDIVTATDSVKSELRGEIQKTSKELRSEMKQMEERMIQHFDVVAENIHRDVAGANRDEILAIQDKIQQHDTDIAGIKHKVGIS